MQSNQSQYVNKTPSAIDYTEEMVMNPDAFPDYLRGSRYFRIEYINEEGFSNYEGHLLVPGDINCYPLLDMICEALNKAYRTQRTFD